MKSLASLFLAGHTDDFKIWRACTNKRRFSEEYAKQDADRINKKNDRRGDKHRVTAYPCEHCGQWHVGGKRG